MYLLEYTYTTYIMLVPILLTKYLLYSIPTLHSLMYVLLTCILLMLAHYPCLYYLQQYNSRLNYRDILFIPILLATIQYTTNTILTINVTLRIIIIYNPLHSNNSTSSPCPYCPYIPRSRIRIEMLTLYTTIS